MKIGHILIGVFPILYQSNSYNQDVFVVCCTIRELCISRGEEHCLFNVYELEEFIEFLSTWCFIYMSLCYCYIYLYLFFMCISCIYYNVLLIIFHVLSE